MFPILHPALNSGDMPSQSRQVRVGLQHMLLSLKGRLPREEFANLMEVMHALKAKHKEEQARTGAAQDKRAFVQAIAGIVGMDMVKEAMREAQQIAADEVARAADEEDGGAAATSEAAPAPASASSPAPAPASRRAFGEAAAEAGPAVDTGAPLLPAVAVTDMPGANPNADFSIKKASKESIDKALNACLQDLEDRARKNQFGVLLSDFSKLDFGASGGSSGGAGLGKAAAAASAAASSAAAPSAAPRKGGSKAKTRAHKGGARARSNGSAMPSSPLFAPASSAPARDGTGFGASPLFTFSTAPDKSPAFSFCTPAEAGGGGGVGGSGVGGGGTGFVFGAPPSDAGAALPPPALALATEGKEGKGGEGAAERDGEGGSKIEAEGGGETSR
eukprot:g6946.t1